MIARHVKLKMNKKLKRDLDVMLWRLTGAYNWAIKTVALESTQVGVSEHVLEPLEKFDREIKSCPGRAAS